MTTELLKKQSHMGVFIMHYVCPPHLQVFHKNQVCNILMACWLELSIEMFAKAYD